MSKLKVYAIGLVLALINLKGFAVDQAVNQYEASNSVTAQTAASNAAQANQTTPTNRAVDTTSPTNKIDIAPIVVEAKKDELRHDFKITNQSNIPIIIQATPTLQVNTFEPLSTVNKTKEIIIAPAIKVIQPGKSEHFRVHIRKPSSEKRLYRIYFKEVLPRPKTITNPDSNKIVSTVRFGLQFGVPIYYNFSHEEVLNIQEEIARRNNTTGSSVDKAQKTLGSVMNNVRNSQTESAQE